MSDQLSHGAILDIIEQSTELTFQAVDYMNYEPGKPFKSGVLSFPETANNRAALGELYDSDGANKVRIIPNVLYENETSSIQGSLVITGQSYVDRINSLTGFFIAGNGLLWLDFGDTKLRELDWSSYEHLLNITNVQASEAGTLNSLIRYDLTDRGRFIDVDTINLIERYPAFNIAEMLKVIFRVYDIQSNFITEPWFTPLYLMFTENNEIRNDEDWKTTAMVHLSGGGGDTYNDTDLNAWTDFDVVTQFALVDTGTDDFDNGLNFDPVTHVYTVPKTGTYRFKATISGTIITDDGTGTEAGMRFDSGGGNPKITWYFLLNGSTIIGRTVTQDYDFTSGSVVFTNETADTDYLELTANDTVEFYWSIKGQYYVASPPATGFTMTTAANAIVTNQVSRYYSYGSTVKPSELLPDITVNEFLKMVFMHFAITPQFSQETNIVRLNIWKRQTTGIDMSYKLDPTTGEVEYLEAFNYEVQFKPDTSDKFAEEWFKRNDSETGNYKANNGSKVLQIIQSDFSNTVMQIPYRLDADRVKLPTMWSELPEGSILQSYTDATCPEWKTKYNYRILVWSGVETGQYKFGYHVAGEGRTVADVDYYIFKPYTATVNIEFADRDGVTGLFNRLHKAYIERQNNGTILTIQGKSDLLYLTNIANCDATQNLTAPFYLNFNPYAGRWTVQKIVSDGIVSQYTLILNNE